MATFSPDRPRPGQLAMVTVKVRNATARPTGDIALVHEVSPSTELRGASSTPRGCTVGGRRVDCRLGPLGPGQTAVVKVRVKVVDDPPTSALVQRLSLSTGPSAPRTEQTISALIDHGPPAGPALLDVPGPLVKLLALVTFVLAAHPVAAAAPRRRRRRT